MQHPDSLMEEGSARGSQRSKPSARTDDSSGSGSSALSGADMSSSDDDDSQEEAMTPRGVYVQRCLCAHHHCTCMQ